MIILFVIDHRNCQSSKTKIYRTVVLISCFYCCLCFYTVARIDHYHARNGTHQCNILVTLMGCSVLSYGDSRMCRTDLYIQMRISDGVTHLLESTSCCKHCKRAHKRYFSTGRKSCCDSCHICFCNSTVDMPLRELFTENFCLGCRC